jgi:hypothetical protein
MSRRVKNFVTIAGPAPSRLILEINAGCCPLPSHTIKQASSSWTDQFGGKRQADDRPP